LEFASLTPTYALIRLQPDLKSGSGGESPLLAGSSEVSPRAWFAQSFCSLYLTSKISLVYKIPEVLFMELAKITTRGQITLPIEIRKALNVREGDKVVFVEENGRIIVENAARLAFAQVQAAFQGEAERLGLETEQDVVDMVKEIRGERQRANND
jgi:AbrB family looped-hinge helix DNA binding protein